MRMKQTIKCRQCGDELPATFEYFCKKPTGRYGFENFCKKCRSQYAKQYRTNNLEKVMGMNARYRNNNRDRIIEYNRRKYGWKGGIGSGGRNKKYETKEDALLFEKKSKVLRNQKRRSLAKKLKSDFTIEQWETCKDYFDNKCCYCGKPFKLQQEHFISIKHGGEFTERNILPACRSCNIKKRDKNFFEWYPKQEFFSFERQFKILTYLESQEIKYQEAK